MLCVVLDKLCKMVSALNCNHTELMKDRMVDSVIIVYSLLTIILKQKSMY